MTENLSFYEEQSSNMPQQTIDIINQPTWHAFCADAKGAESAVVLCDPANERDIETTNNHSLDLSDKFGDHHKGMRSTLIGQGYHATHIRNADSKVTFINAENVTFHGVDLRYIDSRWQAVLEFYNHDDTDEMIHGIYYLPPDAHHILTLDIDTDSDIDIDDDIQTIQMLYTDYQNTRSIVASRKFESASPEKQRILLDRNTRVIDSHIPRSFRDQELVIKCARYYTAFDDMPYAAHGDPTPGFDLHDSFTDTSDSPDEDRRALNGILSTFDYPELNMLPPDHPLNAGALDMNDGSYCMVLRSDNERATHYILPQTITEIYTRY